MGNIIGGIFKVILSPLTSFIMNLLYGILIRGPLTILSYLDRAFQWLSGSQVDQLLFHTTIKDGKPQLNFFTSDSPLKMFFIIMLGVAGSLFALFLGISVIKSVTKKGQGPMRKLGQMAISTSLVFAVPAMFLVVLSLAGGVLSTINGEHKNMSKNNITRYSKNTLKIIENIKNSPRKIKHLFDFSKKFNNMINISNKGIDSGVSTTLSLEKIYNNLQDKKWETNTSIKQISQQVYDDFLNLKNAFLNNNDTLNSNLYSSFTTVQSVIKNLKPNIKSENMADQIKELQDNLQTLQDKINKWAKDSKILLSYESNDKKNSLQSRALANYRKSFEIIYGSKKSQKLISITSITNLQDLNQKIVDLISGSPKYPDASLINLRQNLSSLKENSLVVIFYQIASGNKDSNWNRNIGSFKGDGFMLLVGSALIITACVIMLLAALSAVERIFDLALLFIVSPAIVMMSPFDEGQRMRTWINMVVAKLIGIFGVIISLRLFGILNETFRTSLENSAMNKGSSGYLTILFLMGIFGIGGMAAAYKASQTLAGIMGAGYGIMSAIQAGQILRMVRTGSRVAKGVGGMAMGTVGLKTSKNLMNPNSNSSHMQKASRGRLGQVAQTWRNRSAKLNDTIAKTTIGKLGSTRAKRDRLENKFNKANKKFTRINNKRNLKDEFPKIKKDYSNLKSQIKKDKRKGRK